MKVLAGALVTKKPATTAAVLVGPWAVSFGRLRQHSRRRRAPERAVRVKCWPQDTKVELEEASVELLRIQRSLAKTEKDLRWWKREATRMTTLIESRDRNLALFESCMQDIIDETNRAVYVLELEAGLRTAFNGEYCGALGYW
jgi:hypothetical protein